jgi:hypothetical protein
VQVDRKTEARAVRRQTTDIIREWLFTKFNGVRIGDYQNLFVFKTHLGNRRKSWYLEFSHVFLTNHRNIKTLPAYAEEKLLPVLLSNPDKKIDIGPNGEITVL